VNDIYAQSEGIPSQRMTVLDETDFNGAFDGRRISFPRAVGSIAPQ
jgi:hypothetical protein